MCIRLPEPDRPREEETAIVDVLDDARRTWLCETSVRQVPAESFVLEDKDLVPLHRPEELGLELALELPMESNFGFYLGHHRGLDGERGSQLREQAALPCQKYLNEAIRVDQNGRRIAHGIYTTAGASAASGTSGTSGTSGIVARNLVTSSSGETIKSSAALLGLIRLRARASKVVRTS